MKKKVNWDNCRTDNQRFITFWVKIEYPHLYKNATTEQIKGIYARWAKVTKDILTMAGDLESAKRATMMCREWLKIKNYSYTLETIARHLPKFLNQIHTTSESDLPSKIDKALWEQYCRLREEKRGKFDKKVVINYLQEVIKSGLNPNHLLEMKIIQMKRDNSDMSDKLKKIIDESQKGGGIQ